MPIKILAIDDSKTMRLAIKITFAAEDAEVVAVSKGSEAVARAKQMDANVVLVDHTLATGEPSGWEVCRALKTDAKTSSIPVIMLVRGQPDEAKLREVGADGAIPKPFDTQELIDKIRAAAGKPAAKPEATPAAARPAAAPKPVAVAPPVRSPAARPSPTATTRPAAAAARPAAASASGPTPAASGAGIPIAVPIPFAAAGSPTPGMLKRLQEAGGGATGGGAAAGADAQTTAALVALSREVVEEVVWEVVPELAEALIREKQASV